MCELQGSRRLEDALAELRHYVDLDAHCVLAVDGRKVLGSVIFFPVGKSSVATGYAEKIGAAPDRSILWSFIWVDKSRRGESIWARMNEVCLSEARAQGFVSVISFGYETEEIYRFLIQNPRNIATEVIDYTGRAVLIAEI
ncbi:hypothetical protein SUH3_12040 [Pseudosulfitobacter pseudonitzschiae]|uniref:N-acetyltransferase domain-containing protein n=2 Tax=Pseudosulfitobacter pseudonitzschiae TaxID=1402135 RepID=A0A073IW49_9RHOB|nr:hypothetical protein SUH3_12040 [Pseudosulfitobacter pseudonitzschiae]